MAVNIQLRRGTASQWTTANPILADGEPGVENDTHKVKFGDGLTAWNSLPYATGPTGATGAVGPTGPAGADGADGLDGFTTLAALLDVDLTGVVDGNALVYDLATTTWIPGAGGGGGGAGAVGGGTDEVFYENDQSVTADYTITAGKNAMTAGPVSIEPTVTVTVPSTSSWVIV